MTDKNFDEDDEVRGRGVGCSGVRPRPQNPDSARPWPPKADGVVDGELTI